MSDRPLGFLSRLFGNKAEAAPAARVEIPLAQATVGLCFDYERGIAYDSEYLSDVGLDLVMKKLQHHRLRATFHCPAKLCETALPKLEQILSAGHEIAALGYADEDARALSLDALKQMLYACRNAFNARGLQPIGFRAAGGRWDDRLAAELGRHRFVYSAEHDHARKLYVLHPGNPPLVRVPIRTDDRLLRSRAEKRELAMSNHHRYVRRAVQERSFASVCFHPWILAEDLDRMRHWEEWLDTAVGTGVRLVPLHEALPPSHRPAPPAAP